METKKLEALAQQICDAGFEARVEDGKVFVSAENGDDAADYYGEFRGGCPWINPVIEEAAEKAGAYMDWQNPGLLVAVF